jgi:hypothetical protein
VCAKAIAGSQGIRQGQVIKQKLALGFSAAHIRDISEVAVAAASERERISYKT